MKFFLATLCALTVLPSGCGLFDSEVIWKSGHYVLIWIDDPRQVMLCYDGGKGSCHVRVDSRVFSVGSNEEFVVAKQHPRGNRLITNYYIVKIAVDSVAANLENVVDGPFSEKEFAEKSVHMNLPKFIKTLESLQ